ncbi:MAG: PilZ domain-containing protein [Phycisphaerae bacterium]|nr:PilZ domain-containing protein [Phycisphaerae bacterium]
MLDGLEKRRHRRIAIRLSLLCRRVGVEMPKLHTGRVVNVGTGGAYFETAATEFKPGNLTEVRLLVPPESGRLELGGTISTIATVVRTETLPTSRAGLRASPLYGVALEFRRRPKLCQ